MATNNGQAQPKPAQLLHDAAIRQFKLVSNVVRLALGDPFFIELLDTMRAEAQSTIEKQVAAAGMPANLAMISRPVLGNGDDEPTVKRLQGWGAFLELELKRISALRQGETAAAPALAAQALKASVGPDGAITRADQQEGASHH